MTRRLVGLAAFALLVSCTGLKESSESKPDGGGQGGSAGTGAGSGGTSASDAGGSGSGGTRAGGSGGSNASMCTGCAASATCELVDDAPRCVCPATRVDVAGDGSDCVDPCERAGCSQFARCTADGLDATCQCMSPYIGDGSECELDAACTQLSCDANAECVVTGNDRACRCLTGYDGDGMTCSDADDCSPNPCRNGGVCSDQVAGFSCECAGTGYEGETCTENADDCSPNPCLHGGTCTDLVGQYQCDCAGTGYEGTTCADNHDDCSANPCVHGTCSDLVNDYDCACATGYSGDTCNVDSCNPNPCGANFLCTRTATTPSCAPACSSECAAGDPCLVDAHCADGLSCDPDDDVCVAVCSGATIASAADLTAKRFCKQINGNLEIVSSSASFTTVAATDLPYLTRITGNLWIGGEVSDTPIERVTLSALTQVTGHIRAQAQPGVILISLPVLTTIGSGGTSDGIFVQQGTSGRVTMPELTAVNGTVSFELSAVDSVELGKLATIGKNLTFGDFPVPATNVDLHSLTNVTGTLKAQLLFQLPYSDVSNLVSVTSGTKTIAEIGCCFVNPGQTALRYMCNATWPDYDPYCP